MPVLDKSIFGLQGGSGFSGYSGPGGGQSGWSGYSSFSGYSGHSSFSGYSGYSSFSGTSGWSGSGISGWSGSGVSGWSGSGISGWSGWSGIAAVAGTQDYLAKFTSATSLGNSIIQESSGNILINPTYGAELATFLDWTETAGWTHDGSKWTHSAGTTALVDDTTIPLVAGTNYHIVIGYTWAGAGSTLTITACSSYEAIATITSGAASSVTYDFLCISAGGLTFTPTNGFTGTINSVSITTSTAGKVRGLSGEFDDTVIVGNGVDGNHLGLAFKNHPNTGFWNASTGYLCLVVNGGLAARFTDGQILATNFWASNEIWLGTYRDVCLSRETTNILKLGINAASPLAQTIKACDTAAGTSNTAGGILTLASGNSTGSAGSILNLNTSDNTAGAAVVNTSVTRATITESGLTLIPTYGAELITNFAGWTDVADWDYNSSTPNAWHHSATGVTPLVSDWLPTATTKYKIVVVNATAAAGSGCVLTVGGQSYTMTVSGASNTNTFYLTALSTAALTFVPATDWHGDIISCSVMAATNGELTATTGTFTNGLTLTGGQFVVPVGDNTYPSVGCGNGGISFDSYGNISFITGGGKSIYFSLTGGGIRTAMVLQFGPDANNPDTRFRRVGAGMMGILEQDITPGAGTGFTVNSTGHINRQVYKVTVDYTGFSAAALTADHTIATLPEKTKIVGFYADTTVPFTGGTVSAASLIVGKTAGGVEYIATHDVLSAAVTKGLADADMGTELTRAAAIQGGAVMNWTGTTTVIARLTTVTANTNALTAGSTIFYIVTERY